MFDYHIHSTHSFDANDAVESISTAAVAAGLSEICFTEHIEPAHTYDIDWDGYVDFDAYEKDILQARNHFPALSIRLGIEAGLALSSLDCIKTYLEGLPLDFIIASQHMIGDNDPYFAEYFLGKTKIQAETEYLEYLLSCLRQYDYYNVVGHIGYVCQHAPYASPMRYQDYPDLLDEILKTVISAGKGIEVNTSGYFKYNEPMPSPGILQRYIALGGEIITIGSDAHFSSVAGHKAAEALSLLESLGAKYVCTFEKLTPIFHKIKP